MKGMIVGVLALLVFGCGGNVSINRAHVRFLNLVPNGPDLDLYVQGTRVIHGSAFQNLSKYGLYDAGNTTFAVTKLSQPGIEASLTGDVQEPSRYTVVVLGYGDPDAQPPSYSLILLPDQSELPDQTTSVLRIVNGSPAAGLVDVYVTEPNVDINAASPTYTSLALGGASPYGSYAIGSERVRVTPAGSKSILFDSTMFLGSRSIRTLYLRDTKDGGLPVLGSAVTDGD